MAFMNSPNSIMKLYLLAAAFSATISATVPPTVPVWTWCAIRNICQATIAGGNGPEFCVLNQLPRNFDWESVKQGTCNNDAGLWIGLLATCKHGFKVGYMPSFCLYNTLPEGFSWSGKDPGFILPKGFALMNGLTKPPGFCFEDWSPPVFTTSTPSITYPFSSNSTSITRHH
ncbi:hypothetical protein EG327_001832 [Venturia inaequalis]|uniref:Cyanovirin-N domain-containing protein n=1 Tax=Venturia inaequalis TaxID=5025 RepID=A0A8H3Z940_VENIN|nr:hypothetical protein EG327_001832 [Venturia inaequalis]